MTDTHVTDFAARLALHNAGREQERLRRKYRAMAESPFVFLRGTCRLFYERAAEVGLVPGDGPRAWLCGDLHLENFGTYITGDGVTTNGSDGRIVFDVNDFDEAALAPYSLDVLRLATSVLVASQSNGQPPQTANEAAHRVVIHYLAELSSAQPRTLDFRAAKGAIRDLMEELRQRDGRKFLSKRVIEIDKRLKLKTDSDKALPLDAAGQRAIAAMLSGLTPPPQYPRAFEYLDAARRVAGTGSLGIPRDVVLTEGQGLPGKPWLLDVKAARPSAALAVAGPQPAFASEAERVVAVQTHFQAESPALLQAVLVGGEAYIFKQLQPSADKLDIEAIAKDADAFTETIDTMAHLAAWGHLRAAGYNGAASATALATAANTADAAGDIERRAKELAAITRSDYAKYRRVLDAGLLPVK
ncbi:MAG: DUF2252 domain-containing protein [Hyphomicrobiaceae bacterium]|nr:DUF2252 domain-containing protein [Hyphomicrobiaceae bacterium]